MKRVWLLVLVVLVGPGHLAFAGEGDDADTVVTRPTPAASSGEDADPIRVGMVAPDFALVRLADVDEKDPEKAQRAQPVRLSSFRGQRPVLLLLSSYT